MKQWPLVSESRNSTQSHSLLKPPLAMFSVDAVKEESSRLFEKYQLACSQYGLGHESCTHRASKPKHSKRSDVEFTWTNRPKNETHPGVPLHVNWHLKEAYTLVSALWAMYRF